MGEEKLKRQNAYQKEPLYHGNLLLNHDLLFILQLWIVELHGCCSNG